MKIMQYLIIFFVAVSSSVFAQEAEERSNEQREESVTLVATVEAEDSERETLILADNSEDSPAIERDEQNSRPETA